jgi:ABC-type phosphate/phosphonate transport system ATPase subunit
MNLFLSDSLDLENASLLDEIVELLDMGRDAEVIMLIGQSGAGKSAMLNTIHRVLTGENYTLTKQGSGHAQSVTLDLGRFV